MIIQKAKNAAKAIFGLCDSIDETPVGIKQISSEITLRDVLMFDILNFMMYLSASDGYVSEKEARFISELFEKNITPEAATALIKKNDLYSTEFEEKIPLSLQVFVKADKMMLEAGKRLDDPVHELLIQFFETTGKALSLVDGEEVNEKTDLKIYIDNLNAYARRESLSGNLNIKKRSGTTNSLKSKYEFLKKK